MKIQMRGLTTASVTGSQAPSIASVALTPATLSRLINSPPKTANGYNRTLKNQYLHELYKSNVILPSRANFFFQVNNTTTKQFDDFSLAFKSKGYKSTLVKNTIFKSAISASFLGSKKNKNFLEEVTNRIDFHNYSDKDVARMKAMFVGPTVCVYTTPSLQLDPVIKVLDQVLQIAKPHNKKVMFIGARIDGMVLTMDDIVAVKAEFPMGLEGVYMQLLGLLEKSGGRGIVDCLESTGKELVSVLDRRIEEEEK